MKNSDIVHDHEFLNRVSSVEKQNDDGYKAVYKLNCTDGLGIMTVYKIFPGIELIYNEMEATSCLVDIPFYKNIMEINHCQEGREESRLLDESFLYMGKGDLSINMMSNHANTMGFPLKHYKGISILFYIDEILNLEPGILAEYNIDIVKLQKKFCPEAKGFVMRAKDRIEHIFSELYSVPDCMRLPYSRLKVIELLLFLSMVDSAESEERDYYTQSQVDTIKEIKELITSDLSRKYTIEELAKMYLISQTTLKNYFKGVYGMSIATYLREYRIKVAATRLVQSKSSVADIAMEVGYESQSKFASAFKRVMGISPLEYRKKCSVNPMI